MRPQPGSSPAQAPRRWRPAALLACLVLPGCDAGDPETALVAGQTVYRSAVGPVPAYPQRPGDPAKGYDALLNRAVVTCGFPYSGYVKASGSAKRDSGPQFPGRTGRNAALPYLLTAYQSASGVELVTSNCLTCHAATFDGQLVMGLGNAFLDMTQDPLVAVESAGSYVTGRAARAEWRRWADRIGTLSDYMMTDTVGVNSADNLTAALMAHRDPVTLAWSNRALIEPPPRQPLPVAVPPWWTLRKKHALFYSGAGRGDHARFMMLVAAICTDTVAQAEAIDAWAPDVRAYLAELPSPKYPYPIDRSLAERGYPVFQSHCKRCHGTYAEDWRYPNQVVALGKVGTDPELARAGYADSERLRAWFQQSFYGALSQAAPALGYAAPPLDGVWATAPYLHNDSVPTLVALLDSRARPTYWRFKRTAGDQPIYDRAHVGWDYEVLTAGKAAAMSWDERNRIYDTTGKGYGNRGHAFGDVLSAEQRRALVEYLKTL